MAAAVCHEARGVGSLLISWILAGGCERRGRYDRDSSKLSPQNSRRKFLQPANLIHQASLSIFSHQVFTHHTRSNMCIVPRIYHICNGLTGFRCPYKDAGSGPAVWKREWVSLHAFTCCGKHTANISCFNCLNFLAFPITSPQNTVVYTLCETCAQNLQRLAPKRIAEPEVPAPSQQVSAPRRQPASRRQPAPHKRVSAPTSRELSNQATSGEASNTPAKNNPNTAATADYTPLGSGGLQGQSSAPAAVEERDSSAPEIEPECDSDIEIFVRGMVEEANRKKDDD